METIAVVAAITAVAVAFVIYSSRKNRRQDREHQAMMTALSPGPRIHEMTSVRPSPLRRNRIANGSSPHPAAPSGDFEHVATDYGTYTPADVAHASGPSQQHHHGAPCAEVPPHHSPIDTSSCDTGHHAGHDSSFGGGFDGGGHHGH